MGLELGGRGASWSGKLASKAAQMADAEGLSSNNLQVGTHGRLEFSMCYILVYWLNSGNCYASPESKPGDTSQGKQQQKRKVGEKCL